SSRRRHTRSYGDWSSDVCSSDLTSGRLGAISGGPTSVAQHRGAPRLRRGATNVGGLGGHFGAPISIGRSSAGEVVHGAGGERAQIGRASCRERGGGAVGGWRVRG